MPLTAEEVHNHMIRHHLGRAMNLMELSKTIEELAADRGELLNTIQIAVLTHEVAHSFGKFESSKVEMEHFYNSIPAPIQLALVAAILDTLAKSTKPMRFDQLLFKIEETISAKHEMPPQMVLALRYILDGLVFENAVRELIHEDGIQRYTADEFKREHA